MRLRYGSAPRQFGDLRVPKLAGKHPVAIVLHGGFWRSKFNLAYMGHLCESLRDAGVATWNLEYRSIGDPGGGWPGTGQDVASGASYLRVIADAHQLDLTRVVALGHSAGGQLAMWLAAKGNPKLTGAIALGGVVDLERAWELKLSDTVTATFLGGAPDQHRDADPMRLLPLGIPQRLFHGVDDDIVPIEISRHYAERARSLGDSAKLIELPGGHFEPVDPRTAQWVAVRDEIARMVKSSSSSAV